MSRLIIKNLPPYLETDRLRQHFEQKGGPGGTLTDVKVALKPDGTSRRFGFVGYKYEKEALAAKEWFDRTFIDSARINVNVIEGAKDAPAPRPNKRPRTGPSPSDEPTAGPSKPSVAVFEPAIKSKKDKQRDEYLELVQPRSKKGPSWANEAQPEPVIPVADVPQQKDDVTMDVDDEPSKDGLSDMEWMRRHISENAAKIDKAFEQSDDEGEGEKQSSIAPQDASPSEPVDPTKETILQTSRLFVRNLAFSCTDEELKELFQPFGEISQVHIPLDPTTKEPKGLAYVSFAQPTCALAAYEALDRTSFQGRLVHILPAVDRRGKFQVEEGKKTVKGERDAKRKAMAGKEFNWSMLYMNSDAVASSIADRMNISKSDILNPEEGDNAAVKLALAETHIIQETKTYLESQGVLLSSFSTKARSSTSILVKNIPYGTGEDKIRELFEPHGTLLRVLVPPAGTMAVVEFKEPDEAANAFKAVAYRRLGNSVVYLEKAPLGIFDGTVSSDPTPYTSDAHAVRAPETDPISITTAAGEEEEEPSIAGGSTLFVKNLAFSTTQERLNQVFQHLPSFSFARVQTKPDPKRPDGPRLSMGYGFVGFKDVDGAKKALKSMHGFVLDGHALHVKFAGRGQDDVADKDGKDGSAKSRTTKMIVKNLPFEATKKDVRDLFGSHGQLKSVRLPKKFDSRTRGFAFLDFVSRHEAENAFAALRHTHLLGRHLVLEWAEEAEQDLDMLRKKAGVGLGTGGDMPGRKRKLDLGKNNDEDVEDLEG